MNIQDKLKLSLQENQYIIPSYDHYGRLAGFHDYGALGLKIKNKIINIWRDMFLWEDEIDEIETPTIMPYDVLKKSGHVDRFTDYVVYDDNNVCYRADHLMKDYFKEHNMDDMVDKIDSISKDTLEDYINHYKPIKSSKYIDVKSSNLMFQVNNMFLRPELAQGLFVNYKIHNSFFHKSLPFGLAQIGKAYRNEISPKPFTRMREFNQMEIEYFVDPDNKIHPLYDKFKNIVVPLLPISSQLNECFSPIMMTIDDAVNKNIISCKTIGYFLARIYLFSIKIGLDKDKLRFRQHTDNELSHYASECWDLETLINEDWLECIGCADRGDYDLKAHDKNNQFTVNKELDNPIINIYQQILPNKRLIGKTFREKSKDILAFLDTLSQDNILDIQNNLKLSDTIKIHVNNEDFIISKDMISIKDVTENITTKRYYPHVIEPSFGIDRIIYSIFTHNFWVREDDDKRFVLSLPMILSPYDVAIFMLYNKDNMNNMAKDIRSILLNNNISCYIDNSRTTIGKRYCRADEIGIKYAITIDPGSLTDNSVTIRNRDNMTQIRVNVDDLVTTINNLG